MCVLTKNDIKHINQTIHSVACVMHKWCDLGMLGVKELGVEICADAQSTAHSSNNNNDNNNNSYIIIYYILLLLLLVVVVVVVVLVLRTVVA